MMELFSSPQRQKGNVLSKYELFLEFSAYVFTWRERNDGSEKNAVTAPG